LRREHARIREHLEAEAAAKDASLQAAATTQRRTAGELQQATVDAESARADARSARTEAVQATARAEAAEAAASAAEKRLADVYDSHTWRWGRRIVAGPGVLKRLARGRRA
jgi:hypothetical protein